MVTKNEEKKGTDTEIAYQNKDITSKILGENLKNKSFSVYGINIPKIVEVLPTNLPVIEANELRLDNLFLLEDGSLALVDYESTYADVNKIKYLNYIIRTLKRNLQQNHMMKPIRMLVIYTADIEPGQTEAKLDVGCLRFQLEEAFLGSLDSTEIENRIRNKIQKKEPLTQEEQMQLIILPLTYKGTEKKQKSVKRCFELVKGIEEESVQTFLLSGILVFADKIVTREDSESIKRWIMLTKVGQLFEEEKIEAVKAAKKETEQRAAERMLAKGMSVEDVLEVTEILTREEVEEMMERAEEKILK